MRDPPRNHELASRLREGPLVEKIYRQPAQDQPSRQVLAEAGTSLLDKVFLRLCYDFSLSIVDIRVGRTSAAITPRPTALFQLPATSPMRRRSRSSQSCL